MNEERQYAQYVQLADGKLWVVGGEALNSDDHVASTEVCVQRPKATTVIIIICPCSYDPLTDTWTISSISMPADLTRACVAAINTTHYLFMGGRDTTNTR